MPDDRVNGQQELFNDIDRLLEELAGKLRRADPDNPDVNSVDEQRQFENIKRIAREKATRYVKLREAEERRKREAEENRIAAQRRREEEERAGRAEADRILHIRSMELPPDYENAFATDVRFTGVRADTPSDGLILSLTELGRVDIEFISQVSGSSIKSVINELAGSVYQNPETWEECFYKGFETSDEYLSGNLMRKLRAAEKANSKFSGYFARNIDALRRAMPPAVSADDIYVTLGSPWVPPDVIDQFIVSLLGGRSRSWLIGSMTSYDPVSDTWKVDCKNAIGRHTVRSTQTYGTVAMNAISIIEKTLNMQTVKVWTEVSAPGNKSGVKRIIDRDETVAATEKQQLIISKFRGWIFADPARRARLERIYDETYGCITARRYDGSFLRFPGLNPAVKLFPYQKDAAAKILFSPNSLIAHDVGSGKTFIMAAAGMELRRMGISRKNLYVVPNNIVGQWESIFLQLYPQAKLLVISPDRFAKPRRDALLREMRDGDYDGIIIAYSSFELIEMSFEWTKQQLAEELTEVVTAVRGRRDPPTKLKNREKKLRAALSELIEQHEEGSGSVCYDELGVNTLFIDEAHNYKNLPIDTKMDNVMGINKNGSAKCSDMLAKVRCTQKQNSGRGVVFATGTPITNSVTDIFVMQTYLQGGELKLLDLASFDSWAAMYGEKVTEFEVDVDTTNYRLATRFSRFHNLPELTALFAGVADFHQVDNATNGLPEFSGYTDPLVKRTAELEEYIREISDRAEKIRSGIVDRRTDNMLKVTTDGRKAALDIRLAKPDAPFLPQSKVFACAENVFRIWRDGATEKLTQLVFCDTSVPKPELNMYGEGRRLLVSMGVPEEEIAFIHDFETDRERARLFSDMQSGAVRILFGSTFKLGIGVNVQQRLIAIHHLDIPWRPADMVQREGRILRQGNTNPRIYIYRYITDGSFDAYSWQLLETKQRFICQLLSGNVAERSGSDIDDTVLSYAEIKALAIGNPLIKKRVETANELSRLRTLQKKAALAREEMRRELASIPAKLEGLSQVILSELADTGTLARVGEDPELNRRELGAEILAAVRQNADSGEERVFCVYRGFDVLLPANVPEEKPYLWLRGTGRYYVELGESDVGCVVRMDNVLASISDRLREHRTKKSELLVRRADLRTELSHEDNYTESIRRVSAELASIDKKLGVKG